MIDLAKPEVVMLEPAKPESGEPAKPESGGDCFGLIDRAKPDVSSGSLPSAKPAVDMLDRAKPESGGDCFVLIDLAKPDVSSRRLPSAKPAVDMLDLAKPKSGRLLFWVRVEAFCPPSGAGLCTSERADCLCAAYTIDPPALRFRRNTRHTFPEGSHHMFRGTSLLKFSRPSLHRFRVTSGPNFRGTSLFKFSGPSRYKFCGTSLGYVCCEHSFWRTQPAIPEVSSRSLPSAKPVVYMLDRAKSEVSVF